MKIRTRRPQGFTLIELMIVVAIVAILATVAYPSYTNHIRKSRRSDAVQALNAVMLAQEAYRSKSTAGTYSNDLTFLAGVSATSNQGYYNISVSAGSATGYTATATPVKGTSQEADTTCPSFVVVVDKGNITYKYGTNTDTTKTCWSR